MSKPKPNTKPWEVRFALAFLKALRANINNYYLLIAVIAWTRDASGTAWKGNNPFFGKNGKRYSSVTAAANATARMMLSNGQYRTFIRRSRDTPKSDTNRATQAFDFLTLLALTDWDASHFGLSQQINFGRWVPSDTGPIWVQRSGWTTPNIADAANNRLLTIIDKLNGHPLILPTDPTQPAEQQKVKAPKGLPSGKAHTVARPDYIQPYAALGFYAARHPHGAQTPL